MPRSTVANDGAALHEASEDEKTFLMMFMARAILRHTPEEWPPPRLTSEDAMEAIAHVLETCRTIIAVCATALEITPGRVADNIADMAGKVAAAGPLQIEGCRQLTLGAIRIAAKLRGRAFEIAIAH
jgi:hypothetical protein